MSASPVSFIMSAKCSECGRLRTNDTNHWLVGWFSDSHGPCIGVAPLDEQVWREVGYKAKVFCGENCTTRWFIGELSRL